MLALGFFLIMMVLFFVALFFICLNIIFLIIWKVKKRRGNTPKKRYVIIPIIFLIISILVELIPVSWVMIVRSSNERNADDIIMAESGKIGYWGYGKNGDDTIEKFEIDGITYVNVFESNSEHKWKLGEPVANIRPKSYEKISNKIMRVIFGGDYTSTLYEVVNEEGFELYSIGGRIIYCPENKKSFILEHYK